MNKPAWNKGIPDIAARKPVMAICIKTKKEVYYPATNKANGFNSGHIVQCCKGRLNQHKGYYWRYAK